MWYSQNNRSKRIRNTYNRKTIHRHIHFGRLSCSVFNYFSNRVRLSNAISDLFFLLFFSSLSVWVFAAIQTEERHHEKKMRMKEKKTHTAQSDSNTHTGAHILARALSLSLMKKYKQLCMPCLNTRSRVSTPVDMYPIFWTDAHVSHSSSVLVGIWLCLRAQFFSSIFHALFFARSFYAGTASFGVYTSLYMYMQYM